MMNKLHNSTVRSIIDSHLSSLTSKPVNLHVIQGSKLNLVLGQTGAHSYTLKSTDRAAIRAIPFKNGEGGSLCIMAHMILVI